MSVVGLPQDQALIVATVVGALYALFALPAGRFSDRVGRRWPMLGSAIALAVLCYPAFLLLSGGNLALVFLAELMLLIPVILFTGGFSAAVSELLPTADRFAGMGIGHNFGNALLGATAPAIATALVHATGNDIVPAFYLIAASVLIIPVIYYLRETAHDELAEH